MKAEWGSSAHYSSGHKVGGDSTEAQEAASALAYYKCLIQANHHRKSTSIAWDPISFSREREKPASSGVGNETEEGIVCEYLLGYNAIGYYIILRRALNKVIMGEVIFVIKLALTLGHKSWVWVRKKLLNMPPLPHTVLLLNTLILLQILH